MQPTIPSIFQFASCEGRNHRRPSIGEQQGQDRKKRISHSHWLMELQRRGWLPLLSQQPSNRAVGIVTQAPVFQGLCLKSIRPSKVGDSKTSQCTCGQEHGPPIFLAPSQTGRSQRKGLMGTTTQRARSAGQQCNGGERRRSSFLSSDNKQQMGLCSLYWNPSRQCTKKKKKQSPIPSSRDFCFPF